MHETFDRTEKLKASSDRAFGRLMAAVFLLIGLIPLLHAPHEPRWWAVVIAAAFEICAEWWTAPLAPLNRLWFKLGLLLHKIVTPIVMGLIFFLTVLPVGLLCACSARTRCGCAATQPHAATGSCATRPGRGADP